MELKNAIIATAASALEKLSFPDGILPLGIEGRKLIAETVLEEIAKHLAPPHTRVVGDMIWEDAEDGSGYTRTDNAIYQAKAENGIAWLIVHGHHPETIMAGVTVEDAMRAAAGVDRTLTAVSEFRKAFFPADIVDGGAPPSLVYRMHDFDDWGVIRNRDGSVFASLRRPVSDEELAAHREAGTDPYQALGLLLVDAVDRARGDRDANRNLTFDVCSGVVEQHRLREEQASDDIRSTSWERTEARYRASAATAILADLAVLADTMPTGAPHPDDLAVDRFAIAMKSKLAKKRADGYDGWSDPALCTTAFLSDLLVNHIRKGDPVDVGNFAMMIHQRGASIANDRERYADMAKNRPHHKFEFPERERVRERILNSPDDAEVEAGQLHPEAPEPAEIQTPTS